MSGIRQLNNDLAFNWEIGSSVGDHGLFNGDIYGLGGQLGFTATRTVIGTIAPQVAFQTRGDMLHLLAAVNGEIPWSRVTGFFENRAAAEGEPMPDFKNSAQLGNWILRRVSAGKGSLHEIREGLEQKKKLRLLVAGLKSELFWKIFQWSQGDNREQKVKVVRRWFQLLSRFNKPRSQQWLNQDSNLRMLLFPVAS